VSFPAAGGGQPEEIRLLEFGVSKRTTEYTRDFFPEMTNTVLAIPFFIDGSVWPVPYGLEARTRMVSLRGWHGVTVPANGTGRGGGVRARSRATVVLTWAEQVIK
jgi:hypothetical protein